MIDYKVLFEKVQEELNKDPSLAQDMQAAAEVRLEAEAIMELRQALMPSSEDAPVCFTFA